MKSFPPIRDAWCLTGPTGSSKSAVGVRLAELGDAEIVSMDSMAVYRGMDIGTAKPSREDRERVRHHLVDVVEPTEEYSIAEYLAAAHLGVDDVRARGRNVLFVGGTPLYLKALLRGLCSGPEADWDLRNALASEVERNGPEALHRRLASIDPRTAQRVHPQDTKRLIRALEVFELTGEPISDYQDHFQRESADATVRVWALHWPREMLYDRINHRVDQMFEQGLVDEVQQLMQTCAAFSRTADQAVGYREVVSYLQGDIDLETAIQEAKTRTRRLARRQMTWLRRLPECRWITMETSRAPDQVAQEIAADTKE